MSALRWAEVGVRWSVVLGWTVQVSESAAFTNLALSTRSLIQAAAAIDSSSLTRRVAFSGSISTRTSLRGARYALPEMAGQDQQAGLQPEGGKEGKETGGDSQDGDRDTSGVRAGVNVLPVTTALSLC